MKNLVRLMSRFGRKRILDFRDSNLNLFEGFEKAAGEIFYFNLPMELWRHPVPIGSVCTAPSKNPMIKTLQLYSRGECSNYKNSPLYEYYKRHLPVSMADALGLNGIESGSKLGEVPAYAPLMPWAPSNLLHKLAEVAQRRQDVLKQLMEAGGKGIEGEMTGILHWGPVSSAFGEALYVRLIDLYRSIREHGYQFPPPQHLRTQLLVNGTEFRVLPRSGKHRVAVLAALEHPCIPVVMGQKNTEIVKREEVEEWPHVKSRLFTTREAISLFDQIFEGCFILD